MHYNFTVAEGVEFPTPANASRRGDSRLLDNQAMAIIDDCVKTCGRLRTRKGAALFRSTWAFFEFLDLGHIGSDASRVLAFPRTIATFRLGGVMVLRHVTLLGFFSVAEILLDRKVTGVMRDDDITVD